MPRISAKVARRVGMNREELRSILDPARSLASITTPGGSNPSMIPNELENRGQRIRSNKMRVSKLAASQRSSEYRLRSALKSGMKEVRN